MFKQDGMNNHNWKIHQESFTSKKKIVKATDRIAEYFKKLEKGKEKKGIAGSSSCSSNQFNGENEGVPFLLSSDIENETEKDCMGLQTSMESGYVVSHYP